MGHWLLYYLVLVLVLVLVLDSFLNFFEDEGRRTKDEDEAADS